MKLAHMGMLSVCAMLSSCTAVYTLGPQPAATTLHSVALPASPAHAAALAAAWAASPNAAGQPAAKSSSAAVRLDTRVGHSQVARDGTRHTFVLVEARGADIAAAERPASATTLVIDRSGSMAGERLRSAVAAARGWIARAAEGDIVSVVAFADRAEVIVPATRIGASSRRHVMTALDAIRADGGTCLSCGLHTASAQLTAYGSRARRVVLLSDGEANAGLIELEDFRAIAHDSRRRSTAITTIGVGDSYNERVLSALAFESNGRHHFVADAHSLASLFESEANQWAATVATELTVGVELPAGVELVGVHQRAHRIEGRRVSVPLGALSRNQVKTVLIEVQLPSHEGPVNVATVDVRYRDHIRSDAGAMRQSLAAVVGAVDSAIDPLVAMRLERGHTGTVLAEANRLFMAGERSGALQRLQQRAARLRDRLRSLSSSSGGRLGDVRRDLERQLSLAEGAERRYRASEPHRRDGRLAVRATQEFATMEFE